MTLEEIQNLRDELLSEENIRLKTMLKVCILERIESYLTGLDKSEETKVKFDIEHETDDPLEFLTEQLECKLDSELDEIHEFCIEYEEPENCLQNN